jgi:hypothetical protein
MTLPGYHTGLIPVKCGGSNMAEDSGNVAAFGRCESCGEPRTAEEEDGDLVLVCLNGHRTQ